jgi:hypothetical protein
MPPLATASSRFHRLAVLQTVAISTQHKESTLRSKRLKRDASLSSLGPPAISREPSRTSLGGEALSEAAPEVGIAPEDVAAEVQAAVDAIKAAKPVGSEVCLDTVRRLRQLLSNYDEPPFKEAVQGLCRALPGSDVFCVLQPLFSCGEPAHSCCCLCMVPVAIHSLICCCIACPALQCQLGIPLNSCVLLFGGAASVAGEQPLPPLSLLLPLPCSWRRAGAGGCTAASTHGRHRNGNNLRGSLGHHQLGSGEKLQC